MGVYNKIPGDGRELAVTDPGAVTIRAEDGRPVSGVDISPFISSLPSSGAAGGTGRAADAAETELSSLGQGAETAARSSNGSTSSIDIGMRKGGGGNMTECFSTRGASGSTSQAANVVEALEAGATALLLDEDTCAGNVRGARGWWGRGGRKRKVNSLVGLNRNIVSLGVNRKIVSLGVIAQCSCVRGTDAAPRSTVRQAVVAGESGVNG